MWKTRSQNSHIHALLSELRISKENKAEIIGSITKGRSMSAGNLTRMEAIEVIKYLENLRTTKKLVIDPVADRMRKKILSICHEMQWTKDGKLDWERINAFLFKSGYKHKALNSYSQNELPTLVTQFEQLLKDYYVKR